MLASHLVYRFGDFIYGIRNGVIVLFLSLQVLTLKRIIHNTPETIASFQGYVSVKEGRKDHNSQHMSTLSEFSSVKDMTSFIMHYSAPS